MIKVSHEGVLAVAINQIEGFVRSIASMFGGVIKVFKLIWQMIKPVFELVGNVIGAMLAPLISIMLPIARLINKLLSLFYRDFSVAFRNG